MDPHEQDIITLESWIPITAIDAIYVVITCITAWKHHTLISSRMNTIDQMRRNRLIPPFIKSSQQILVISLWVTIGVKVIGHLAAWAVNLTTLAEEQSLSQQDVDTLNVDRFGAFQYWCIIALSAKVDLSVYLVTWLCLATTSWWWYHMSPKKRVSRDMELSANDGALAIANYREGWSETKHLAISLLLSGIFVAGNGIIAACFGSERVSLIAFGLGVSTKEAGVHEDVDKISFVHRLLLEQCAVMPVKLILLISCVFLKTYQGKSRGITVPSTCQELPLITLASHDQATGTVSLHQRRKRTKGFSSTDRGAVSLMSHDPHLLVAPSNVSTQRRRLSRSFTHIGASEGRSCKANNKPAQAKAYLSPSRSRRSKTMGELHRQMEQEIDFASNSISNMSSTSKKAMKSAAEVAASTSSQKPFGCPTSAAKVCGAVTTSTNRRRRSIGFIPRGLDAVNFKNRKKTLSLDTQGHAVTSAAGPQKDAATTTTTSTKRRRLSFQPSEVRDSFLGGGSPEADNRHRGSLSISAGQGGPGHIKSTSSPQGGLHKPKGGSILKAPSTGAQPHEKTSPGVQRPLLAPNEGPSSIAVATATCSNLSNCDACQIRVIAEESSSNMDSSAAAAEASFVAAKKLGSTSQSGSGWPSHPLPQLQPQQQHPSVAVSTAEGVRFAFLACLSNALGFVSTAILVEFMVLCACTTVAFVLTSASGEQEPVKQGPSKDWEDLGVVRAYTYTVLTNFFILSTNIFSFPAVKNFFTIQTVWLLGLFRRVFIGYSAAVLLIFLYMRVVYYFFSKQDI